jgi:hypothetical protein
MWLGGTCQAQVTGTMAPGTPEPGPLGNRINCGG